MTPALAVVRPGSINELAEAVRIAIAAGITIVPRGGGMSYADGHLLARPESMIVDLLRLDRIVEVNEEDLYVVVECGATWKQLHEALVPHALRTPYWSPLSGLRSTVGGALSHGSVFLGSGLYGPVLDSLIGLEVAAFSVDPRRHAAQCASTHRGRPAVRAP